MKNYKNYLPHLLAFIGFIILSLAYFNPVLSGKEIIQSDIVQYTGMAKEQMDYRTKYEEESYWTNSAFGGMPTYQLGAKYPHNYVKQLDSILRFLPRPADYLFLYFIGFYILLLCLKVRPLKAFAGALLFGFSTYLIVIIGAGHNAKAHAIAYMPMVLAGVLLVFRKRYIVGGLLTMVAAALEIGANHFQMTYYLLLLLLAAAVFYTIDFIKKKEYKELGKVMAVFLVAAIVAIGSNATNLMATSEYAGFSTRSKSDLTLGTDGLPKPSDNAMSHEYITEYSYGLFETFNLFVPRLMGGGDVENLGVDSNVGKFFVAVGASPAEAAEFSKHVLTYWGNQPGVAAPAYIGAVVIFLFILALFTEHRKIKYVFITGIIFSIILSWGHNFFLTDLMIDYFPMYNKFRAVTSIQVIAEICFPALALLGLQSFFNLNRQERLQKLKKASIVAGSIIVFLFICKGFLDFASEKDNYYSTRVFGQIVPEFIKALIEDRSAMYTSDLIRTFIYVAGAAGILYFFSIEKLKMQYTVIFIGALAVIDLVSLDLNYVNKDNFVEASQVKTPFQPTAADQKILQDTTKFRVFELSGGFNSARTSYFHHSLGGYHAAKPKKIQELFDYQIAKNNHQVLNMMNVKYVIDTDDNQQPIALENPEANGNAWFVSHVEKVATADEAMQALTKANTKTTAVVENKFADKIAQKYVVDSLASVKVADYRSDYIKYKTNNANDGLVVFSEVYYPKGWKITIDGKTAEMIEANYTLRALPLPKGNHTIEFKFEPQVIKTGSTIALISNIAMFILLIGGTVYLFRNCNQKRT